MGDRDDAVDAQGSREDSVPSSVLEKGVIYFFFRGRVDTDEPHGVQDIARSYLVLRPVPAGAALDEGAADAADTCRVCAIPKKVLPQRGGDRWIGFVEKAGISLASLQETFLSGHEYSTKTRGLRHVPAATPVGEGVYAITSTGRESHLVYFLTIPEELGEAQKELGLKKKGSFIVSTRNPQFPPPKYAQLPQGPDYPKEQVLPRVVSHLHVVNANIPLPAGFWKNSARSAGWERCRSTLTSLTHNSSWSGSLPAFRRRCSRTKETKRQGIRKRLSKRWRSSKTKTLPG